MEDFDQRWERVREKDRSFDQRWKQMRKEQQASDQRWELLRKEQQELQKEQQNSLERLRRSLSVLAQVILERQGVSDPSLVASQLFDVMPKDKEEVTLQPTSQVFDKMPERNLGSLNKHYQLFDEKSQQKMGQTDFNLQGKTEKMVEQPSLRKQTTTIDANQGHSEAHKLQMEKVSPSITESYSLPCSNTVLNNEPQSAITEKVNPNTSVSHSINMSIPGIQFESRSYQSTESYKQARFHDIHLKDAIEVPKPNPTFRSPLAPKQSPQTNHSYTKTSADINQTPVTTQPFKSPITTTLCTLNTRNNVEPNPTFRSPISPSPYAQNTPIKPKHQTKTNLPSVFNQKTPNKLCFGTNVSLAAGQTIRPSYSHSYAALLGLSFSRSETPGQERPSAPSHLLYPFERGKNKRMEENFCKKNVLGKEGLRRDVAFQHEVEERLLVYSFMPKFSVSNSPRQNKPEELVLVWKTRKRMALGASWGLEYLHEYCKHRNNHRNVKAANVLLVYESVILNFAIAVGNSVNFSLAMDGIAVSTLRMLSTIEIGLSLDEYGLISDNVGRLIEFASISHIIRERTDALDAAGNTAAVVGKGFAIGYAALGYSALFGAFVRRASISAVDMFIPKVFIVLIVGAIKDFIQLSAPLTGMNLSINGIIDDLLPFDRFGPFARIKMKWSKIEKERWQQKYCAISAFINRAERHTAKDEMQGVVAKENKLLAAIGKAGDPHTMNADMAIVVNTEGIVGEGMIAAIDFHVHFISQVRNLAGDIMRSRQLDAGSNWDASFASSLLGKFKDEKTKCPEPSRIVGHVVEFIVDQYGSRFIQRQLDTATIAKKTMGYQGFTPHPLALKTDVFGNHVIQHFFALGLPSQRREIEGKLSLQVLTLSLQYMDVEEIQKAIPVVDSNHQIKISVELNGVAADSLVNRGKTHKEIGGASKTILVEVHEVMVLHMAATGNLGKFQFVWQVQFTAFYILGVKNVLKEGVLSRLLED